MADKRLQRIMAEDDRLFKAMQPGQKGKGASSIRGSEKPASKAKKKKPKRKVSNGVSQFDVLAYGVVDAIQRAMAPVSSPARETFEEVEASADSQQGQTNEPAVSPVPPQSSRGQEVSPSTSVDIESREPERDAEPDHELSESTEEDNIGFEFAMPKEQPKPDLAIQPDVIDVQRDVDFALGDDFTLDVPEVVEIANFAAEQPDDADEIDIPLVQQRRERAQAERKAAAKNFQQQQQAPVLGIPNPVPMQHADQDHRVDMVVNEDEVALAIDETANTASALMRSLVDLMDKFSEEMQALSVRVRNIELVLDRL